MYQLFTSLAKLAAMSGRVLVFPDPDCRSDFIRMGHKWTKKIDRPLPFIDDAIMLYGPFTDLKCSCKWFLSQECLGVGLTTMDF